MRELDYDFNFWWKETTESCGWEIAPTADEIMTSVLETEPEWANYRPLA